MKEKRRQQGNKQVVKIYKSAAIHFLMWTVYARNEKRNLNSFHGERETEMKGTLHNKKHFSLGFPDNNATHALMIILTNIVLYFMKLPKHLNCLLSKHEVHC